MAETMRYESTERGFRVIKCRTYDDHPKNSRLVQESSAIGDYEDSMENPGSSYLWIADHFHLNREEVFELYKILSYWMSQKRLPDEEPFVRTANESEG